MTDQKLNSYKFDVKVGGDPEFFIFNKNTKRYVSAHNRVPGTKKEPFVLNKASPSETIQADGTAVEINIKPSTMPSYFLESIHNILKQTRKLFLRPYEVLVASPCVTYSPKDWEKLPKSALELGCDPDYNAYTGMRNPTPDPAKFLPRSRTGAGHISLSWRKADNLAHPFDPEHFSDCAAVVRRLDLLYFLYMYPYVEGEYTPYSALSAYRHQLYGARGAFRPKPWGVEYRSPSNLWLLSIDTVGNMVQLAKAALVSTIMEVPDTVIVEQAQYNQQSFNSLNTTYCHVIPATVAKRYPQVFDPTPAFLPNSIMNLAYRHKRKSSAYAKNMHLKAPSILKPGDYEYVRS